MLHHLCGWCSDATHRRGPGVERQGQNSARHLPKSSCLSLLPYRLPAAHLQAWPLSISLALNPLDNSQEGGAGRFKNPFDPEKGKQAFTFPASGTRPGAYTKPSWKPDLVPHGSGPSTWEAEAEVAHELEASPGYVTRLSIRSEIWLCLRLNDGKRVWGLWLPCRSLEQTLPRNKH